jgi:hypothetical protein
MSPGLLCTVCGQRRAWSEAELARWRARKTTIEPPPFRPGICFVCARNDPAFRADFDAWLERVQAALLTRVRSALARPLELIDEFVEQFR